MAGTVGAAVTLSVAMILATGCSQGTTTIPAASVAPADLLLDPAGLPAGFTPVQLPVKQLIDANATQLSAAQSTTVTPQQCRPSADADLNHRLTEADTAVLGAQSGFGNLVELVTMQTRDLGADIAATTGACARTETTIRQGNLAGTTIVTVSTVLPQPPLTDHADDVEQMHVVESATTTTLPDKGVQTAVSYSGYALLTRPGGVPVRSPATVSLTVSGETTDAVRPPAPAPVARPPMSREEFVTLFGTAVTTAAQGHT
ncbi:hypothetical protein ABLE92_12705 [Gordonia sp. VNQ95]|uniref:hypothetical protein n=1 Tax=Gordonia sp. VNQ95 TaxID=3156619 RepID=UPI0032B4FD76